MKSLSSEYQPTAPVIAATAASLPEQADALARARAFAEPLLSSAELRVQRLVDGAGGAQRTVDLRPDDEDA